MTALLDRVPADLRGLIRPGSPLFDCGHRCVCREVSTTPEGDLRAIRHDRSYYFDHRIESFALDLTSAVGRDRAADWTRSVGIRDVSTDEWSVFTAAQCGEDMTPEQIDTLARLVYRAAGRLP